MTSAIQVTKSRHLSINGGHVRINDLMAAVSDRSETLNSILKNARRSGTKPEDISSARRLLIAALDDLATQINIDMMALRWSEAEDENTTNADENDATRGQLIDLLAALKGGAK